MEVKNGADVGEGATPVEGVPVLRTKPTLGGSPGETLAVGVEARMKALAAKMERETKPPKACQNCGEHEPDGVVVSPTPGRNGAARLVWWCAWCRGVAEVLAAERERRAAEEAERAARRRRAVKGRIATGRHGREVMSLAYRWGGFTARQLAEALLDGHRAGFEAKGGDAWARAYAAARETLTLLRESKLMKSLGIERGHVGGLPKGRFEEYYHLHGAGVVWGANLNGVADEQEARDRYKRHQLPSTAEHSTYRNDVFLRWHWDTRVLHREAVEAGELESMASRIVVPKLGNFEGETFKGFPLEVAKFVRYLTNHKNY